MNIHKTHTRNDLISMIDNLPLPIQYGRKDFKDELKKKIITTITEDSSLHFTSVKYPEITNVTQLLCYLRLENPKRRMTSKEKDNIIALSKKIIHYCEVDYNLEMSDYEDTQQIVDDMNYIRQYGDLLSVRKACNKYNEQSGIVKLEPILSVEKQEMMRKKKQKNSIASRIKFQRKHTTLTFD